MMKSKSKPKNTSRQIKWKKKFPKSMRCSKNISKREVYSNTAFFKKQEKSQINNLNLQLKELETEEQKTPNLEEGKKS